MLRRALTCSCIAALASAAPAAAISPVSNTALIATIGHESGITQLRPAAAWDARAGRFLVTWSEDVLGGAGFGSPRTSYGRFIGVDGAAVGPTFQITGDISGPLVYNEVTGEFGLVTRGSLLRITRDGIPALPAVPLADPPRGDGVGFPGLAVNGTNGEYLLTYAAVAPSGGREVFARRVTGDGTAVGPGIQVSQTGATTVTGDAPDRPAVTWSATDGGYLVVWVSGSGVEARRLTAAGAPAGPPRRISGPSIPYFEGPTAPAVAHLPGVDEFLVSWASGERVLVQRLSADGTETGTDDRPLIDFTRPEEPTSAWEVSAAVGVRGGEALVVADGGPYTDVDVVGATLTRDIAGAPFTVSEGEGAARVTKLSAVAYAPGPNRYLTAWQASDAGGAIALSADIYVRVLAGGAASDPVAARCRSLPPAPVPVQPAGRVRLTEAQLRTNRRIALAALRRAQGVQAWLAAGVQSRDLCQSAIGPTKFRTGTVNGYSGVAAAFGDPDPRPVAIPAAVAESPGPVRLTAARLLADQRIAQAALRRVAAVQARLDAGLTGADIADGAIGRAQLAPGFRPLYVPVGPSEATGTAATVLTPAEPRRVVVSAAQLRINQRISRAALLRADALIRRLEDGIGPDEIRDGALGAEDLAPGVAVSTIP